MATTIGQVRVRCATCGWKGRRVRRQPEDTSRFRVVRGVLPPCSACGGTLEATSDGREERKAAKAKAELREMAGGARA
jgi:hypothetical protein